MEIKHGDYVTIRTTSLLFNWQTGKVEETHTTKTGCAVSKGSDGWVLSVYDGWDRPATATPDNVVAINGWEVR